MSMIKKVKKGFTLIELVVVIAVIAILSAISVVSYVSITNKAKQSNDQLLVDQVNRSILSSEILKGKRNTVHDVVEGLEEDGFKIDNLKAEAKDYRFAYAMEENKFVIVEKDNKVVYPTDVKSSKSVDLWIFTDKTSGNPEGYSYYLKGDSLTGDVAVTGGLDVGNNKGIGKISYSSSAAQTVVIRTNSAATSLEITAPQDSVKHYGTVGSLNIVAIKTSSYHEYGKVGFAEVKTGRLVLESESEIKHIHVNSNGSNAFDEVIIQDNGAQALPDAITRDEVSVSGDKVQVVKVESNSGSETVYVYADGATGSTQQTSTQNVDVTSSLGQKVLDNGGESKALDNSEKQEAKAENVDIVAGEEVAEESKEGANYVARIGVKGYASFKEAVDAAQTGEVIWILKDRIVLEEDIGSIVQEGPNAGEIQYGLKNDVKLSCNTTIELGRYSIFFLSDGKLLRNSFTLTLIGSSFGSGIYNCQDLSNSDFESSSTSAIVKVDLVYTPYQEELQKAFFYSTDTGMWINGNYAVGGGESVGGGGDNPLWD